MRLLFGPLLPLGSFISGLPSPAVGVGVEVESPFPSVLEGTGGSEDETSLFCLPSAPVGTGREAVDDTSGELLLVETGRESVGGDFRSFPLFSSPPFEGETVGEVEETVGDEMEELRTSEETLVGRTEEDVGSAGGVEEDETELSFCPPSVTVT